MQEAIDRRFYHVRLARGDLSREPEFALLPDLVREGETAFDVGANLGGYTIRLSELVGPAGQVHAFEPVPRTFRLLQYNVARLAPYPNVRAHCAAVSDCGGRATLHIPLEGKLENFYTASLAAPRRGSARAISVELVSLDDWYESSFGKVTFVKIDTEGAEWQILRGAERLLREFRPSVLCEIGSGTERFGHRGDELIALMQDLGYVPFRYDGQRLREARAVEASDVSPNSLFCHPTYLARLAARLSQSSQAS